jgi:hypothetical protein
VKDLAWTFREQGRPQSRSRMLTSPRTSPTECRLRVGQGFAQRLVGQRKVMDGAPCMLAVLGRVDRVSPHDTERTVGGAFVAARGVESADAFAARECGVDEDDVRPN